MNGRRTGAGAGVLLVDAGNSRVKWAAMADGVWISRGDFPCCAGEVELQARFAEAWSVLAGPRRVVVSNVAGRNFGRLITAWAEQIWQAAVELVVPAREDLGVVNAYLHPERLGADRWAALVAVCGSQDSPACVVDCGSAITIDALAAHGEHLGGLIVPGIDIMRQALMEHTSISLQPDEAGAEHVSLLARTTTGGIQGGALYACVAVIDRVIADLRGELGEGLRCVITGGDAGRLLPLLADAYQHEPDLVLQGLARFAADGAEQRR